MSEKTEAKSETKALAKPKHHTVAEYERSGKLRAEKSATVAAMMSTPEERARVSRLSGGSLNAEQLIEIVASAIVANPLIAACTGQSLITAAMHAAELGILPSSVLQLAHFVPYKNNKLAAAWKLPEVYEAKLIPDYKGLIFLARESGSMLSVSAGVIYGKATVAGRVVEHRYEILEGSEDRLVVHAIPPEHPQADEQMIYAWASCKVPAPTAPGGTVTQWIYMTRAQVLKVKATSRAASSGPWVTTEPEMWKKTAIKRLSKIAPRRGKFARAVELDDAAEAEPEGVEPPAGAAKRKGDRLTGFLGSLPAEQVDGEIVTPGEPEQLEIPNSREPTDEELARERAEREAAK